VPTPRLLLRLRRQEATPDRAHEQPQGERKIVYQIARAEPTRLLDESIHPFESGSLEEVRGSNHVPRHVAEGNADPDKPTTRDRRTEGGDKSVLERRPQGDINDIRARIDKRVRQAVDVTAITLKASGRTKRANNLEPRKASPEDNTRVLCNPVIRPNEEEAQSILSGGIRDTKDKIRPRRALW
jgi:hypothetical protein